MNPAYRALTYVIEQVSAAYEDCVSSPYESGWAQGHWTLERFKASGWQSAKGLLANLEIQHQENWEECQTMTTDLGVIIRHQQFLSGRIASARESLHMLMAEGY